MHRALTPARKWQLMLAAAGALLACAAAAPLSQTATPADPVQTDGDKYHVLLENPFVRVLAYRDVPGDKTHPHHHPCFLLYAVEPFERRLTFPDGTQKNRMFHAGEVAWMPEQTHIGENVGRSATNALLVELKGPCDTR